jgi:hypothetical protein
MFEVESLNLTEVFDVSRVRAGPSPFDIVDPEIVQLLRDSKLVMDGQRDILCLCPVPKCGILYGN